MKTKRDTIRSLAKEINQKWPVLTVIVEPSIASTDRKVGRLRIPGKGRRGTRIKVYGWSTEPGKLGPLLLSHDNAETYRHTGEVRAWIEQYAKKVHPLKAPK